MIRNKFLNVKELRYLFDKNGKSNIIFKGYRISFMFIN